MIHFMWCAACNATKFFYRAKGKLRCSYCDEKA